MACVMTASLRECDLRLPNVSVGGYHARRRRTPSLRQRDDTVLPAHVRAQSAASHETDGSPRMNVALREDGLAVGRQRVARLMRESGLKACQKRRWRRTTGSSISSRRCAALCYGAVPPSD